MLWLFTPLEIDGVKYFAPAHLHDSVRKLVAATTEKPTEVAYTSTHSNIELGKKYPSKGDW